MRRTSERLRGGSVPPLESEQTVNPPLEPDQSSPSNTTTSQHGRGRGRGRQNVRGSIRPATHGPSNDRTPAVTLTVPGKDGQVNPDATSESTSPNSNGNPSRENAPATNDTSTQTGTGTTVIYPRGESSADLSSLISKDNVNKDADGKPCLKIEFNHLW